MASETYPITGRACSCTAYTVCDECRDAESLIQQEDAPSEFFADLAKGIAAFLDGRFVEEFPCR